MYHKLPFLSSMILKTQQFPVNQISPHRICFTSKNVAKLFLCD
ncbi:hypothetical protein COXBURSA331_A2101 [Coxiella burnetii RSA 331]|nr:hypothetical protein COXBURSA331_A2101 [Coxiella burnetii RSA 331]